LVNLELGLRAPSYVHICDVEFLGCRRGLLASRDDRAWFERRQPGAWDHLEDLAREVAFLARAIRSEPKKVLVLDLDNTLWGGVIAEEGIESIEIGGPTPRGQAFRAFQRYCLMLKERGVLLAVCSKNEESRAADPFLNHPEMVLRLEHFAAFKASWKPKGESLREIARALKLGLDSLVFVDDSPAEVEQVRQLVPEVTAICLGPEPHDHLGILQDARLFEPRKVTREDTTRTESYLQEARRQTSQNGARSIDEYLQSLDMHGRFAEFTPFDLPRIAQLINKTNQFNLTTRRKSEAEAKRIAGDPNHLAFTLRLSDRFGDYGLIAVVIGRITGRSCQIETWVMSCRVLQRQAEEETLSELVRRARQRGCERLVGIYFPTSTNGIVEDLYPRLGFRGVKGEGCTYEMDLAAFEPRTTRITIVRDPPIHARLDSRSAR
jgi:FkbH-like protein